MSGVGQRVIGRFLLDFIECADVVVDRNVEAVGVVFPVRHARDGAVFLLVHAHKPAGKPLGRSGQQREVQPRLLALVVHIVAHEMHNLQAQVLRLLALAVVLADEGNQRLGKADEADGERAVL